tara:strand:- start:859 stop:1032 length:174 start_codon:yes stop_codon:yes gene_type:complete
MKTPEEILSSTTPEVKKLISEILKYEKEYQHFKNLSKVKDKENELCKRIIRLIESEG